MAEMTCAVRGARLLALAIWLALPLAGQTSLSIYSDGRAVVRRTLARPLDKGRNAVSLELDGVDPAMLFSPDSSVTLLSAVLRPLTDRAAALERAAGQTLAFARGKGDTVRATVVHGAPPQYRLADGRMLLAEPGEPLFPAELVRTTSEAALVLEAARPRPTTELAYVTEGARWSAVYQVVLGGGRALVSGTATIASQRLRAESAAVQLVAGAIARAKRAPGAPLPGAFAGRVAMLAQEQEGPAEEAVGETHVYTLPARVSLEPGVPVATALFPRAVVAVTQEFIVPGALPFRGYLQSGAGTADPNRVPVQSWYTLARAPGSPFGDRPLPAGTVQLFQADSGGRLQLVGEAANDHTAPGRNLRVLSGDAFDVTAERVETDFQQEQIPPPRRGLPVKQRFTVSYRVTLANAKPGAVMVDVREARAGGWTVVASSVPSEKLSATEFRFRIPVPARGGATLTYTVQVES
jgi:hypothetical protein